MDIHTRLRIRSMSCTRVMRARAVGRAPVVSNVVRTYGLPPVSRSEDQPLGRKSNLSKYFLVVQLPCDTGTGSGF